MFVFYWKATFYSKSVVSASSGVEADKLFRIQLLADFNSSNENPEMDLNSLHIRYVDTPCIAAVVGEEWEKYWKNVT